MNSLQAFDTLIAFVTVLTICSMFVLIVVQMVSAALSLRGKNLANALAATFQTVAPGLNDKAHMLAQRILTSPVLSDSMWKDKDHSTAAGDAYHNKQWSAWSPLPGAMKLANSIRPQEVYAALQKLAALKPLPETDGEKAKTQNELQQAAASLLKAAGASEVTKDHLSGVVSLLAQVEDGELKQRLETAVGESAGKLLTVVQSTQEHLTTWLNAATDRSQQWFQSHTRNITIAASIVFSLICQIDAVELFQHVSTDSKARAALVDSSAKIIAEGGDSLDDQGGLPARVAVVWNEQQTTSAIEVNPAWQQVGEVEAEAQKKMPDAKAFEAAFAAAVNAATKSYYDAKTQRLRELQETFQATGFDIIPAGGWRWGASSPYWHHLPGMLLFAGLLSLGAPYWFNMLKNLASLRPALAQMIGAEQQAKNAAP